MRTERMKRRMAYAVLWATDDLCERLGHLNWTPDGYPGCIGNWAWGGRAMMWAHEYLERIGDQWTCPVCKSWGLAADQPCYGLVSIGQDRRHAPTYSLRHRWQRHAERKAARNPVFIATRGGRGNIFGPQATYTASSASSATYAIEYNPLEPGGFHVRRVGRYLP